MPKKQPILPEDSSAKPIQLTPDKVALSTTLDDLTTSTSEITLNEDTKIIEVIALDGDIILKYGETDITTSNFDEYINSGQVRHYVVPDGITSINVASIVTASLVLIEK